MLRWVGLRAIRCPQPQSGEAPSGERLRNDFQMSLKVIGNVTVRQSEYDFLLPFHSNYGPILYRFPHIARHWSKMAKFIYLYLPPCRGDPVGISQRCLPWMTGLYHMLKKLRWHVNRFDTMLGRDRRTDGQTDRIAINITRQQCCADTR